MAVHYHVLYKLSLVLWAKQRRPTENKAGLNEREAPGKVVTARPPKRLAQLRGVSHASSFQLCRSTGQKRQNWYDLAAYTSETVGGDHEQRLVFGYYFVQTESYITKKIFLIPWHCTTIFFVINSLTIFTTQMAGCETCGLLYCWSLLPNNNTATNLQTITSSYGNRRFLACAHGAPTAGFFHPGLLFSLTWVSRFNYEISC